MHADGGIMQELQLQEGDYQLTFNAYSGPWDGQDTDHVVVMMV